MQLTKDAFSFVLRQHFLRVNSTTNVTLLTSCNSYATELALRSWTYNMPSSIANLMFTCAKRADLEHKWGYQISFLTVGCNIWTNTFYKISKTLGFILSGLLSFDSGIVLTLFMPKIYTSKDIACPLKDFLKPGVATLAISWALLVCLVCVLFILLSTVNINLSILGL